MNMPIKDLDIVIDSIALGGKDSDWFAKQLAAAIPAKTNIVTNQYGVSILSVKSTWMLGGIDLDGEVIEIANARKESYGTGAKGYKPTEVEPATIQEDINRRDFSFNALLWRLQDLVHGPEYAEIVDLTGVGKAHLEQRLLSTPLDPDKTFQDDATRILRVVKFYLRFPLKIAPEVEASIRRNAGALRKVPWEAVAKILVGDILNSPQAMKGIRVMRDLGILDVLVEMIRELPPFSTYLARQLAQGNHSIELLLELADLGVAGRVISFLDAGQRARFKSLTSGMNHQEARQLLESLNSPKLESSTLIEEFNLQGRDRGILIPYAREAILDDPSLAMDPAGLTDAIRRKLQVTRRVANRYLSFPH